MSRNFHVVSMCSIGNGGGAGKNALRARCSSTEESLPIEYSSTGRRGLGGNFTQDVDALGFERPQMRRMGRRQVTVLLSRVPGGPASSPDNRLV